MLYKDLVFENNLTGLYIDSMKQLVQLPKNINVKCNNINIKHEIDVIYNKTEIYIPLGRKFDIIFNISNIDNDNDNDNDKVNYHIIKKELYGNIFNKICDIEFNEDFVLPIVLIPYTEILVKLTFDNILNIPEKINLIYTGGLLQTEYRLNHNIIYPLSNFISNGCIQGTKHTMFNFNIIMKTNQYSFPVNGFIYELKSKYDHDIKLEFGKIMINTNLLNITNIPCIADYNCVKLITNSYNLELEFEVYSSSSLLNRDRFIINNVEIKIEDCIYKVVEASP